MGRPKRKNAAVPNGTTKQRRRELTVQANKLTKITDVNQFCLEKICTYLNLEDLFNVANANKYLQLATYSPYARQHAKKTVCISLHFNHCDKKDDISSFVYEFSGNKIINQETELHIRDFKTAMQMLRCFGHTFVDLSLTYINKYRKSRKINYLLSYINEFCAESLTKIQMNTGRAIEEFKKPFLNIERVELHNSLSRDFNMNIIFPKLRHLICLRHCNPQTITPVVNCPNLERLQFGNICVMRIDKNRQTIADFLRLNPQLRSFAITFYHFNVLSFIAEHLQSTENLYIFTQTCYYTGKMILFSNVKSLTVYFFNVMQMIFPMLLPQLKEFTIEGMGAWSEYFIDFIKRHQSIEKITIKTNQLISFEDSTKLMAALPMLQSISIIQQEEGEWITLDIITYLPIFKRVRSFYFEAYAHNVSEDKLKIYCSRNWHITCVNAGYINRFTLRPIEIII